MQLSHITDANIDAALSVLRRGLADPPTASWAEALGDISSSTTSELNGPIGHLLSKDGTAVGVMLTLRGPRRAGTGPDIINLSSWYIDEACRWYAPMMLRKILRERNAVFTDLTASQSVQEILPTFKFERWTEGVLLTSLPQSLHLYRRDASVVSLDKLETGEIGDEQMSMLRHHQRRGCHCCVLRIEGTAYPLIFVTRYRKKIPHAYLIYTPDRRAVISALGNVCAHLLKFGYVLVAMDCNADERPTGSSFRQATSHKYVSGPVDTKGIDYAYSELVYLGGQ